MGPETTSGQELKVVAVRHSPGEGRPVKYAGGLADVQRIPGPADPIGYEICGIPHRPASFIDMTAAGVPHEPPASRSLRTHHVSDRQTHGAP